MKRWIVFVLGLAATLPGTAKAQIPWESPMLLAPGAPSGLAVMFIDYGLAPDDGLGGLVTWRSRGSPGGTGLRLAVTRRRYDDVPGFAGGFDFSLPMFQRSAGVPFDAIWTTGVGGSWADYGQIAVPLGFAVGRVFDGSVLFSPYVGTRVVFEGFLGSERPEDFDYGVAADLGFDVAFDRGRDLRFRFAASLGDRHALVAGLHAVVH